MNKTVHRIILSALIWLIGSTALAVTVAVGNSTESNNRISSDDTFNKIKTELGSAVMVTFDILITIESDIFDEIDSAYSEIYIANDSRYFARLNDDIYLYDGDCIWEYSAANNQATKRCPDEEEIVENRLAFIKNLDKYYTTTAIEKDSIYNLLKKTTDDESLPDNMRIYLKNAHLSCIQYYDLNNDLNQVDILSETISDSLDVDIFKINLPDSVEVITLP